MRLVCISDTHGQYPAIPDGDVLIHAGDLTMMGQQDAILQTMKWIGEQPHKYKIVIAGNHDFHFEIISYAYAILLTQNNGIYLQDSGCEIEGIKFWGSPITPRFHDLAFNRQRGEEIRKHWDLIPLDTNVLITHGPPAGSMLARNKEGQDCGCLDLMHRIEKLKDLKHHIFGHIHEGYGQLEKNGVISTNCSVVNRNYQLTNVPVVIDL